ncbi:hypothetical protein BIV60_13675 [Bacillus sp. MUM 116]|nr:hypothetical protein BIV60_13675 [Bacillus sp. MUM 116]
MQKKEITQLDIDELIENAQVEIIELFGKCTMVAVQLENGFVFIETTKSKNADNYNKEENVQNCFARIKQRIWDLESYKYQS